MVVKPRAFVLFAAVCAFQTVWRRDEKFVSKKQCDSPLLKYELLDYDPEPNVASVVIASDKKFRVQVMTENLFRFEYSTTGTFEDRPTLAVVNRNMTLEKQVDFQHYEQDGKLFILTAKFNITYVVGSGIKSPDDLRVVSLDPNEVYNGDSGLVWQYGMTSENDAGNLLGTYRTLDQTDAPSLDCKLNKKDHCVYGLISRNGWALVDDSDTPILDCDDWWSDEDGKYYKHNSDKDWYLFAHNKNYTDALRDYTIIGGKIPIFPRYATGVWWSRWFYMTDNDVRDQIEQFRDYSLPLDVLVLDMNWHKKNDWTGYTFDPHLFPSPTHFFRYVTEGENLAIAANLHDASGINSWEAQFEAAASAINFPDTDTNGKIPFDLSNQTQTLNALEDVVLKALQEGPKKGFDFWWIDWQQGENAAGTTGGKTNPTIWTDKMRVTNPKRWNMNSATPQEVTKRGMVLARFGGLGNHRYPVGFSGDVKTLSWADLAYQPYFSQTASNVGYGFWSHDIVGPANDHELYVRWIQWGTVSGIMRHHDRGMSSGQCANPFPSDVENSCPIVQPWKTASNFFHPIRDALQKRQEMIPYIYSQTKVAFDTGLSLIRPMYYYSQTIPIAYNLRSQYYFGDKMVIRPIVEKGDNSTMATVTVWLPQGGWYETTGLGNRWIDVQAPQGLNITAMYDISEIPTFVHEMTVLPTLGHRDRRAKSFIGRGRGPYQHLNLKLHLCDMNRAFGNVYQDDGETTAYLQGKWSNLAVFAQPTDKTDMVLNITGTMEGNFEVPEQSYSIIIPNVGPPDSVKGVGGISFEYNTMAGYHWWYDVERVALVIELPTQKEKGFQLIVTFQNTFKDQRQKLNQLSWRMHRAKLAKLNLDETRKTPGSRTPEPSYLAQLVSLPTQLLVALESSPKAFFEAAASADDLLTKAQQEVANLKNSTDTNRLIYSINLLK